ncbi:MAG: hypothetical protein HZB72_14960 [Burkholderiales bacterium]|nr:hypothetical protein [Burkholderiales bacterium]
MARLLEKLDRSSEPVDAAQYRHVVQRLQQLMADCAADGPADDSLHAVLEVFPAAAELYENLHYAHAGLCCAPLERSLQGEAAARDVIERARRR